MTLAKIKAGEDFIAEMLGETPVEKVSQKLPPTHFQRKEALNAHFEDTLSRNELQEVEYQSYSEGHFETTHGDFFVLTKLEAYERTFESMVDNYFDIKSDLKDELDLANALEFFDVEAHCRKILDDHPEEVKYYLAAYDHEEHKVGDLFIYQFN